MKPKFINYMKDFVFYSHPKYREIHFDLFFEEVLRLFNANSREREEEASDWYGEKVEFNVLWILIKMKDVNLVFVDGVNKRNKKIISERRDIQCKKKNDMRKLRISKRERREERLVVEGKPANDFLKLNSLSLYSG